MPPLKDLSGKTFGYLTVIGPVHWDKNGARVWRFSCVCGKVIERVAGNIVRTKSPSCGCKRRSTLSEQRTLPGDLGIKNLAYGNHLRGAKARGYTSFLAKEDYLEKVSEPCHYCGDFSFRVSKRLGTSIKLNSLDRINNEPYYKPENTVSACFVCQMMKRDMSYEDFKNRVTMVFKHMRPDG